MASAQSWGSWWLGRPRPAPGACEGSGGGSRPLLEPVRAASCPLRVRAQGRRLRSRSRPFLRAPPKQSRLASEAAHASSAYTLPCGCPRCQPARAASARPTQVPSLGPTSEARVPAPSPQLRRRTRASGWGVRRGSTDCLCSSPSALAAAHRLLCSPLRL